MPNLRGELEWGTVRDSPTLPQPHPEPAAPDFLNKQHFTKESLFFNNVSSGIDAKKHHIYKSFLHH